MKAGGNLMGSKPELNKRLPRALSYVTPGPSRDTADQRKELGRDGDWHSDVATSIAPERSPDEATRSH